MKIVSNITRFNDKIHKPVLTIGKFDGVHLGHKKLIDTVLERSKKTGGTPAAITFHPHPKKVLQPQKDFDRPAPGNRHPA